jgi:hypothetical protein
VYAFRVIECLFNDLVGQIGCHNSRNTTNLAVVAAEVKIISIRFSRLTGACPPSYTASDHSPQPTSSIHLTSILDDREHIIDHKTSINC